MNYMKNKTSMIVATKNKGKIKEIRYYLKDLKVDLFSLGDFRKLPEIIEDGLSFQDNSIKKARTVAKFFNKLSLADDSGLEVDLLNGMPGVFSSRYSGQHATDKSNRDKLLSDLSGAKNLNERSAKFVCHLVLWDPHKNLLFETDGICEGNIGFEEKGAGGFGYDCIFIPKGFNRTMAQLTEVEKNQISHRGKALKKFVCFLENNKYLV
ncbi:MAG: RdgB/HAM1 family non-canonical purine NTP pyrophosphatase [Actinomycetota bacterium]|nr:RdgB/HAM1 family non-canonical purine NTP pyrophosphatase [Actinomycetota bacterium]